MSNAKKTAKTNPSPEELQAAVAAALQKLIAQGKKEGMIRASDLNAQLDKLQLTPEKIEEIYDQFDAMNIPVITAELDLGDDLEMGDEPACGLFFLMFSTIPSAATEFCAILQYTDSCSMKKPLLIKYLRNL